MSFKSSALAPQVGCDAEKSAESVELVSALKGEQVKQCEWGKVSEIGGEGEKVMSDLCRSELDMAPNCIESKSDLSKHRTVTRVLTHVPLGIVTETAMYILRRRNTAVRERERKEV